MILTKDEIQACYFQLLDNEKVQETIRTELLKGKSAFQVQSDLLTLAVYILTKEELEDRGQPDTIDFVQII